MSKPDFEKEANEARWADEDFGDNRHIPALARRMFAEGLREGARKASAWSEDARDSINALATEIESAAREVKGEET